MIQVKIDELECDKDDLIKLIGKYHALGYFVEISMQNIRFSGFGFKTANYLLSVYKLVEEQEETTNE
ncbi:hypothetical protein [Carnobacterium inhibens]|uniref:hypothetical protein n=1 Tax=Carnobacterium inhibens TaxID=147709 RepID=UPI000558110F|nr:hypothetical protein [Carnobacterium inhibens]